MMKELLAGFVLIVMVIIALIIGGQSDKRVMVDDEIVLPIEEVEEVSEVEPVEEPKYEEIEELTIMVTAYNTVPAQTSGDPCFGANGNFNLCEALERGENLIAYNNVPFGTLVLIDDIIYTVMDRMPVDNKMDIVFPADQIQEARNWGKPIKNVKILRVKE